MIGPVECLVHQRVGVLGATDPPALLEQHTVDLRVGLGVGAAEGDGMLDEPAVARRDVLVELHDTSVVTVRPRSRVRQRSKSELDSLMSTSVFGV